MKNTRGRLVLCLLVACWASPLHAAAAEEASNPSLGPACYGPLSVADKESFFAFDRELRAALEQKDAVAMAVLVELPLRVNYPDGSAISLTNTRAIQTRFEEVFPPALRGAVLGTKREDTGCTSEGAMYGQGHLWVQAAEPSDHTLYRIIAVNLPAGPTPGRQPSRWNLDFSCDTKAARIVIDSDANRAPRYRSWKRPHALSDPPDTVITGGSEDYPGSGSCRYRTWSFRTEAQQIELSLVSPCAPDDAYPRGATAEITVTAGETVETHFCF